MIVEAASSRRFLNFHREAEIFAKNCGSRPDTRQVLANFSCYKNPMDGQMHSGMDTLMDHLTDSDI